MAIAAAHQALAARDGELVGRVLKRVPLSTIFDETSEGKPPLLPGTTLVALLQHLSSRLAGDADLRLKWLDNILLNANAAGVLREIPDISMP